MKRKKNSTVYIHVYFCKNLLHDRKIHFSNTSVYQRYKRSLIKGNVINLFSDFIRLADEAILNWMSMLSSLNLIKSRKVEWVKFPKKVWFWTFSYFKNKLLKQCLNICLLDFRRKEIHLFQVEKNMISNLKETSYAI